MRQAWGSYRVGLGLAYRASTVEVVIVVLGRCLVFQYRETLAKELE